MAVLSASTRFNILRFAFPSPATQTASTYVNNPLLEPDVLTLEYDGGTATLTLLGDGLTVRDTRPVRGDVDKVSFKYADGEYADWTLSELLARNASSFWAVTQTASTDDDASLLASCLSGDDSISMSVYGDKVHGYEGNDRIHGSFGRDTLYGDGGYDVLIGGNGADRLIGDAAEFRDYKMDTFTYYHARESGITERTRDVIEDFTRGVDVLDFRAIDADASDLEDQDFTGFIRATQAFTKPGQLKFVNGVLYANLDADAAAEFSVQFTGLKTLSMSDILG